jgi:hypothetical protein
MAHSSARLISITVLALALHGCGDDSTATPRDAMAETDGGTASVSLENDVMPIVSMRCGGCHTRTDSPFPDAVQNMVYFEREEDLLGLVGSFIVAGDAGSSGLIQILRQEIAVGEGPTLMPPPSVAPAMPSEEVDVVDAWINQGAEDN